MRQIISKTSMDREIVCPNEACFNFGKCEGVIKYGKRWDGVQRFFCKACKKEFCSRTGTAYYGTKLTDKDVNEVIYLFFNGFPIANIAELKEVTVKTIYRVIVKSVEQFSKFSDYQFVTSGYIPEVIEVDELRVKVQSGVLWVWVAYDPVKKVILDVQIGDRNEETAKKLFIRLKKYRGKAKVVLVDGLREYKHMLRKYLVDKWKKRTKAGVIVKSKFNEKTGKFLTYGLFGITRERVEDVIRELGIGNEINTSLIERLMRYFRVSVPYAIRRTPKLARGIRYLNLGFIGSSIINNFVKPHWKLSDRKHDWIKIPRTPALVAGIVDRLFSYADILCWNVYRS